MHTQRDEKCALRDGPEAPFVQKTRKPMWPSGISVSKSQNLKCFVPEDLQVILAKGAFEQLFGYAYATNKEISCMGVVRRDGSAFTVERFHLVAQEGGSAHTEMDPAALGTLIETLLGEGKADEARAIKCWAHSHPGMGCFWSKTDDNTCRLLVSDYLVSLVVSDDFAVRARLDVGGPLPFTVDEVPVILQVSPDVEALKRYGEEVTEKVKEAVGLPVGKTPGPESAAGLFDDDFWSDYYSRTHGFLEEDETGVLDAVADDRYPFP
jgi:proteasome lid subunit RPN8/RPN11